MTYFTQFDKSDYILSSGLSKRLTNLTTYTAIFSRIADDISFYTYYNVRPDERLDSISYNLYNTVDYYWTIPLINSRIINVWNDLPKDTRMLERYLQKKYPGSALIVDSTDTQIGKFSISEIGVYDTDQVVEIIGKYPSRNYIHVTPVLGVEPEDVAGTRPSNTLVGSDSGDSALISASIPAYQAPERFVDADDNVVLSDDQTGFEVSIQDTESDLNDQKTQIKVIRPEFVYDIVKRFADEIRLDEEQRG